MIHKYNPCTLSEVSQKREVPLLLHNTPPIRTGSCFPLQTEPLVQKTGGRVDHCQTLVFGGGRECLSIQCALQYGRDVLPWNRCANSCNSNQNTCSSFFPLHQWSRYSFSRGYPDSVPFSSLFSRDLVENVMYPVITDVSANTNPSDTAPL